MYRCGNKAILTAMWLTHKVYFRLSTDITNIVWSVIDVNDVTIWATVWTHALCALDIASELIVALNQRRKYVSHIHQQPIEYKASYWLANEFGSQAKGSKVRQKSSYFNEYYQLIFIELIKNITLIYSLGWYNFEWLICDYQKDITRSIWKANHIAMHWFSIHQRIDEIHSIGNVYNA